MRLQFGLLVLAVLAVTAPALAVTVTNKDDKDHKLTILEGDTRQDHLLKPNGVLSAACAKGCVIRLGDSEDDEYVLEGPEVVSIEDNKLFDDGPDARSDAAPGSNAQPPPTKPAAPDPTK